MGTSNSNVVDIFLIFFLIVRCLFITPQDTNLSSLISSLQPLPAPILIHSIAHTPSNNSIDIIILSNSNHKEYAEYVGSDAILIISMMHPREHTAFQFVKQLINKTASMWKNGDQQINYILSRSVIIFMPIVNIDGVKYSFTVDSIQFVELRKNMNKEISKTCQKASDKGVDINRNFPFKFATVATSSSPCSQEFHGKEPFSEPESKAIQTLFNDFKIIMSLDVHSYGNLWIYPYASDENPKKIEAHSLYPQYQYIFKKLKALGVEYDNCYNSLKYVADGVFIDWALEKGSVTFAVQFGNDFIQVGNQMEKQVAAAIQVIKTTAIAFQYYFRVEGQSQQNSKVIKLCVESYSSLQHNVILQIEQQILQGKRLRPSETICFSYNFKTLISITSRLKTEAINPHVYLKMGQSNLTEEINIKTLKLRLINQTQGASTKLYWWDIIFSFKFLFITIGSLCLISSLCGLSIFFERALGTNVRDQQSMGLKEESNRELPNIMRGRKMLDILRGIENENDIKEPSQEMKQSQANSLEKQGEDNVSALSQEISTNQVVNKEQQVEF